MREGERVRKSERKREREREIKKEREGERKRERCRIWLLYFLFLNGMPGALAPFSYLVWLITI